MEKMTIFLILISISLVLSLMIKNYKFKICFICGLMVLLGAFGLINNDIFLNLIIPNSSELQDNKLKLLQLFSNILFIGSGLTIPLLEILSEKNQDKNNENEEKEKKEKNA